MGLEGAGTSNILRSAYDTELKHPGGLISLITWKKVISLNLKM